MVVPKPIGKHWGYLISKVRDEVIVSDDECDELEKQEWIDSLRRPKRQCSKEGKDRNGLDAMHCDDLKFQFEWKHADDILKEGSEHEKSDQPQFIAQGKILE